MANIMTAFRHSTTAVLGTVTAATSSVTHAADSLAFLAESGSLRAQAYRDATAAEIAENAGKRLIYRVNAAKMEVSQQLLDLKKELDADDELAAIFHDLSDDLFKPSNPSALRVAAE